MSDSPKHDVITWLLDKLIVVIVVLGLGLGLFSCVSYGCQIGAHG